MNQAEIIVKCLDIANRNYLNIPYEKDSPLKRYSDGGIETMAANVSHYCKLDVLRDIISNSCLRFTDIRHLDDKTEFIGIMPIIEAVIRDENYDSNFKEFILYSETFQELKNYEQSYFGFTKGAHIREEKLYCVYTCSLSTNDNSIRMWDEYAKEGVNICFDFAWNLFAGEKETSAIVRQKLDNDIIMYRGVIIYEDEKKRDCVKELLDHLEKVYLEVQNELDHYSNHLFYAFKEAVNYMRCFFKNIDYDYEKEYRIVLKVPKDIIDSCSIKGEIKAIGKNEKDQRYVDYGIHKECIKRVSICPFLSNSDIDEANCEIKDILRSNKLETVETVNRPIFPYVGSLTFRMGEEFVNNIALRILQHCYGNTYDRFSAHKSLYISDVKRTVRVDVEEVITDNEKCINLCSVTDGNFEKPIIQSIIKKRIKNVTNYKNEEFKSIELFVFFDEMRISVKSERFRAYIDEVRVYIDEVLNDYNEKFDVIYLGYPYGLVKYDVAAGSIQEISIDRTAYDEFYQEEKLKAEKL